MADYFIPTARFTFETEVKKSRFIATVIPLLATEDLYAVQAEMRTQHPKASHHCLAYLLGSPDRPISAGSNDDGEPSGTAGSPMLNVLQKRRVGDVGVVVTRYFGGTKLGAGGLIRSYGASVGAALDHMDLQTKSPQQLFTVSYPYNLEADVARLTQSKAMVVGESFSELVERKFTVDASCWSSLKRDLEGLEYLGLVVNEV